mmetsp:Transcript_9455/g.26115  ORF Transcript_9455/g.26115 Transcript_9455/m.26115 type:complete len:327 (-) Transcript_9455:91-1071(-)
MVQFNDSPSFIENELVLDDKVYKKLWYSKKDLESFQMNFVKVLETLIKKKKVITKETQRSMIELYDRCAEPQGMKLTNVQMINMVRFYMASDNVVGLEYVIMGKNEDRAQHRREVFQAIDKIQRKTDEQLLGFDRAEVIRKKSLHCTHLSRTFATHLGMAKAASAVLAASAAKEQPVPGGVAGSAKKTCASANNGGILKTRSTSPKSQKPKPTKTIASRRSLMMAQKKKNNTTLKKGLSDEKPRLAPVRSRRSLMVSQKRGLLPSHQSMREVSTIRNSLAKKEQLGQAPTGAAPSAPAKRSPSTTRTRRLINSFEARSARSLMCSH